MQDNLEIKKQILKKEIGSIIKEHRTKQNKSISLISAEIGMTKSMWADLEKGIKDPQLSTLIRMADALNIKSSKLLLILEERLGADFSMIE